MERIEIPEFENKKDLFKYLATNQKSLIAQKKAIIKHADGLGIAYHVITEKGGANKAEANQSDPDTIKVRVVINTTNFLDSHDDVHLKGIWTKSLDENKNLLHLREHQMKFDYIISEGEDLKAYVKSYTWKELGYDFEGSTEALTFDSTVKRERNEFMFNQYQKGYVNNHSVSMQYVKLILAINDEDYATEFDAWEKYLPEVANKELAESRGYFWAVKEAKAFEGSAVPRGSNSATPTLDNNLKTEPVKSTQTDIEPSQDTQKSFKDLLNNYELKI